MNVKRTPHILKYDTLLVLICDYFEAMFITCALEGRNWKRAAKCIQYVNKWARNRVRCSMWDDVTHKLF